MPRTFFCFPRPRPSVPGAFLFVFVAARPPRPPPFQRPLTNRGTSPARIFRVPPFSFFCGQRLLRSIRSTLQRFVTQVIFLILSDYLLRVGFTPTLPPPPPPTSFKLFLFSTLLVTFYGGIRRSSLSSVLERLRFHLGDVVHSLPSSHLSSGRFRKATHFFEHSLCVLLMSFCSAPDRDTSSP